MDIQMLEKFLESQKVDESKYPYRLSMLFPTDNSSLNFNIRMINTISREVTSNWGNIEPEIKEKILLLFISNNHNLFRKLDYFKC